MTSFLRVFKIGLVDFWRNRWLSLAATIMMAMTIFSIAVFVLLNLSVNETAHVLQDKIDVAVFFKDSAQDAQIQELRTMLLNRSDVKDVQYVSREDAVSKFRATSEKYRPMIARLLQQGYGTKLPRSLSVKANNPESLEGIAAFISQPPYDVIIESLSYEQSKIQIDKFIRSTAFIKKMGIILSAIFIGIAILVIYNTIRLTIYMRKEEIEIMQLVGATGWYIKFPFILEGIMYGTLATIITSITLIISAQSASPFITAFIASPPFDFQFFFVSNLGLITGIELFIGVVIGALCSYLAVRRHLR